MKTVMIDKINVGDIIRSKYTTHSDCIVLTILYNEYSMICYLYENNKIVQELVVDYEWMKLNI